MSASPQSREQRKHQRITCELLDSDAQMVKNISEEGAYLESDKEYEPKDSFILSLVSPYEEQKSVRLSVRVMRREALSSKKYGYGLRFEAAPLNIKNQEGIRHLLVTEEIYAKVRQVFSQVIQGEIQNNFRREASVISELHVDSLKVAELSILLEQAFNQSIFLPDWLTSEEDPEDLTVKSLVKFLSENVTTLN